MSLSFVQNTFKMRIAPVSVLFLTAISVGLAQTSEVRQIGSFKGIKAAEAVNVVLRKGNKESVKVEVENVPLNSVITEVSGNYLKIHMADGSYKNRKVKVDVTYVTLERISAASASSVVNEGTLQTENLMVSGASAASVELTLDAGNVTVDVASAGDIILEGKAKSLTLEATSAGVVDAYNLECETVEASAGSAGNAKVNVTKSLKANASSAGSIRYRGNPTNTDTNSSSGGSVKKSY
jgi:hypothetical protein